MLWENLLLDKIYLRIYTNSYKMFSSYSSSTTNTFEIFSHIVLKSINFWK